VGEFGRDGEVGKLVCRMGVGGEKYISLIPPLQSPSPCRRGWRAWSRRGGGREGSREERRERISSVRVFEGEWRGLQCLRREREREKEGEIN
jgi:hypothetical protein